MRVEETVEIRAPRAMVWERLADPAAYPGFMSSITRLDRAGPIRSGLGARYHIRLQVRSAHAGGLIEVVEFDPGWELAWSAVTGIGHRGRWRLRDGSGGGTRVTFRLIYGNAGFPWGIAVDAVSAPILRELVKRSLQELKRQVEAEAGPAAVLGLPERAVRAVDDVRVLARAGLIRPVGPGRLLGVLGAVGRWGISPAAAYAAAAALSPDRPAVIDEAGTVTFRDVEHRTNAMARGLRELGVDHRATVGVLARNHRGWVEASVAAWKLGARVVYLNTSFAAPELAAAARREDIGALVYDAEFAGLTEGLPKRLPRLPSWEEGVAGRIRTLEDVVEAESSRPVDAPPTPGRAVILTSGTTGAPKGAQRSLVSTLDPAIALLGRIPLRADETTLIAAPLFHAWGFAHFNIGLLLQSTLLLQRRFDPERVLEAVDRHRPSALIAVPVMLQRILELPARTRKRYDTSSLRVVAVSGSALTGDLATRFMDGFGDILYNLYGSTAVAWAAIAGPEELRASPGTAGRPPRGTVVRVYAEDGSEAPPGTTGRIFVGNELLFDGYTGGGSKETLDGLMGTGDRGHFDGQGLLFVEGRDDDMIVSGGENVYPGEVEEVIARLPGVAECAVVGVPDERFGQALKAFVVRARGARVSEESVKAAVRSRLARYKVPKAVEFVRELPRNATGKVTKQTLAGGSS